MDIVHYFNYPEELNKETLYDLRKLHDATFDEELRRAAIYITDRRVLFNLVEAAHYQLHIEKTQENVLQPAKGQEQTEIPTNRTVSLIDNFLEQIPNIPEKEGKEHRKPTPIDATVDYVAFLMNSKEEEKEENETPELRGQSLIDNFIHNEGGKIILQEDTEYEPEDIDETDEEIATTEDNGYFTETLARIYIKQGRYSKALEIINRLNLVYPKKNRYFADQIRFLQKLIINNNKK